MVTYIPQQQAQNQTLATAQPTQADAERLREMQDAWIAYRGKLKDPLKVDPKQPNDNVRTNRCAPIVDKGVSFLFGPVLKIECTDDGPDSDEQQFVDELWGDDDDRMTLLAEMEMNGGVCGTEYCKLIPSEEPGGCPRIVILDPKNLRIITNPEDCTQVLAYIIEYPAAADMQKRQLITCINPNTPMASLSNAAAEVQNAWTITNYVRVGAYGNWVQGESEDWPYPFAPVFHCKNLPNPNEAYGTPDLTHDLIGMNKSINFALSNISRIIKYHGHPKTWMKGVRASQIQVAVDETLVLESPEAEIGALAAMENFTGLLAVVADLRSDMDEQSRIPAVALGRLVDLPKGNISGVALQLLFQPLLEKTTLKRRLYGRHIRDITRAALVIAGVLPVEQWKTYKVDLHWQNLLPIDDLAAAQTALILQQIGVSNDTIMQELGYDADTEADKSAKEDEKKLQAYSQGRGMPPAQQDQQMVQQDQEMQQKAGEGNS